MLYFLKGKVFQKYILYELYGMPIVDQQLQPEQLIYSGFPGSSYLMKISPDGKYMAIVVADNGLFFLNLETKQVDYQRDWPNKISWPPSIYWSPDSQRLGFSPEVDNDLLYSMDIATGKMSVLLSDEGYLQIMDWRCISTEGN
jgi:Tol biopolymer transport system component